MLQSLRSNLKLTYKKKARSKRQSKMRILKRLKNSQQLMRVSLLSKKLLLRLKPMSRSRLTNSSSLNLPLTGLQSMKLRLNR